MKKIGRKKFDKKSDYDETMLIEEEFDEESDEEFDNYDCIEYVSGQSESSEELNLCKGEMMPDQPDTNQPDLHVEALGLLDSPDPPLGGPSPGSPSLGNPPPGSGGSNLFSQPNKKEGENSETI